MKNSMVYGLLLILACLPASSFGARVSGLYDAEVKVFSQKRSERSLAMISALAEVLAKVSGQRDAIEAGNVAKAVKRPARFLQQYRYRALSVEERQRDLETATSRSDPQMVVFVFDKAAVDKLLRENDLPVWGATRPATLVWLAVEDEGRRYMVGSDSVEPLREELLREARRRGLAVLLPLMDLEDQTALSFASVWAGYRDSIDQASHRYRAEAVLVGRLYRPYGGEWQGQWTLLESGFLQSWRGEGVLPTELLDEGVAGAIDILASRYAPAAGQQQAGFLPVTVTDVRNLDDYARVSRYLKSLQQVSQVHTARVEADRITFELDVRGSPESFSKTVSLGNVLTPYKPLPGEAGEAVVSWASSFSQVYQLLP
jgi:hypothetical protein